MDIYRSTYLTDLTCIDLQFSTISMQPALHRHGKGDYGIALLTLQSTSFVSCYSTAAVSLTVRRYNTDQMQNIHCRPLSYPSKCRNPSTYSPLSSPDRTDTSFRPFLRPADRRTPMAFPRVSLEICLPTYLPIIQTSNAEPTKKSHRCNRWTEPAFSRQHVPFHTNFK